MPPCFSYTVWYCYVKQHNRYYTITVCGDGYGIFVVLCWYLPAPHAVFYQ